MVIYGGKKIPGNPATMVHFLFFHKVWILCTNVLFMWPSLASKKLGTSHHFWPWLTVHHRTYVRRNNFSHIRWMTNLSLFEHNRLRWRCAVSCCIKASRTSPFHEERRSNFWGASRGKKDQKNKFRNNSMYIFLPTQI
jgi:hypothetical protein